MDLWTYGPVLWIHRDPEIKVGNVTQWAAAFKENTPKRVGKFAGSTRSVLWQKYTQILLESKLILHTESWSHQIREEAENIPLGLFWKAVFALDENISCSSTECKNFLKEIAIIL